MKFMTLIAGLSIGLAGCAQQKDVSALREQVNLLKVENSAQSTLIEAQDKRIKFLEGTSTAFDDTAFLDPAGGGGYAKIDTNVVPIIVSFKDSSPVGDGTRIRLNIGNLSSANLLGLELEIRYAVRNDGSAGWADGIRTANIRSADVLSAGSWTLVEASLPGIKPDSLGFLSVKANLDQLSLRRERP